jgi:two-component system, sensor histidine kinase and response regulator
MAWLAEAPRLHFRVQAVADRQDSRGNITKRLLVLEAEAREGWALPPMLASLGHELLLTNDWQGLLASVESFGPDLILIEVLTADQAVPAIRRVRAHPRGLLTPTIVIASLDAPEIWLHTLESGADDVLEKPVNKAVLIARMRQLLHRKEAWDDLSARYEAIRELWEQQRELTELIVHDLKNPLATTICNLTWALQQPPGHSAELQGALEDAREGAERLQRMVEELLCLAKLESARLPMQWTAIDLEQLVHEVVRAHSRQAHSKGISLTTDVQRGLTLKADGSLLRRVLGNLIENSLRYTPDGGRIALSAARQQDMQIKVCNSGPAIPIDARMTVFSKYARLAVPTPLTHAGLGLYLCKRAMEAHGGSIGIMHAPDWPVCFVLQLPIQLN